jgi:cytochrome c oxidase subunit 1
MHFLGVEGNIRRYSEFIDDYLKPLLPVHGFISIATFITGAAQLIFLFNLFWSMFKGEKATENPWEATTLEWTIPSPPPHDNFAGRFPVVYHGPYELGVPGAAKDYIMQNSPEVVAAP